MADLGYARPLRALTPVTYRLLRRRGSTLAGLGAVFRVTWRDGVAVLREPISGPPEAAELVFGSSFFPGCPRPHGPVQVNDAWTEADPLEPSMVLQARLVSIDAEVGTASVECTSQGVLPQADGTTMHLRARDEIAIGTGLSVRVTCDVTVSAERFRTTTRAVTERAPL